MSNHPSLSVLTPLEFLDDVVHEATHAKNRVWGQAMEVANGKITDRLLNVFEKAGEKGLDTRLHADYYSLLVTASTFNYWPFVSQRLRSYRKRHIQEKLMMARNLRNSGVRFLFTNPPTLLDKIFPARGRNHMKIIIVDDIAWIGGVNFHDENFSFRDVMVRIEDRSIVNEIAYVYEQIDEEHQLRDMAITCNDETTLLVDGGRINRSIILRNTVELINHAEKKVQLVSPLIPDADLLYALWKAVKAGKEVSITAPKVEKMTGIYFLVDKFNEFLVNFRRISLPISYTPFMIHAKILIVDEKEAIVGSHNFSSRGVRMGTEEIALRTTNKTLVTNLMNFYMNLNQHSPEV